MTRSWELVIDWLGRPPVVNGQRHRHWAVQSRVTRDWREAGAQAAMVAAVPSGLAAVAVEAFGRYPTFASMPDPDGIQPAVKAAIDGLVDRGVIADDDRTHLPRGIHYLPPQVAPDLPSALVLRISEVET